MSARDRMPAGALPGIRRSSARDRMHLLPKATGRGIAQFLCCALVLLLPQCKGSSKTGPVSPANDLTSRRHMILLGSGTTGDGTYSTKATVGLVAGHSVGSQFNIVVGPVAR